MTSVHEQHGEYGLRSPNGYSLQHNSIQPSARAKQACKRQAWCQMTTCRRPSVSSMDISDASEVNLLSKWLSLDALAYTLTVRLDRAGLASADVVFLVIKADCMITIWLVDLSVFRSSYRASVSGHDMWRCEKSDNSLAVGFWAPGP